MNPEFWHERWRNNEIGFHEGKANRFLVEHFEKEIGCTGGRIFLPLCGKTQDIGWLMSRGYQVAGAELSEPAIEQLFRDLEQPPTVTDLGPVKRYSAERIDVFVGDIFDLTAEMLGCVDAIYDRAALVALPEAMRADYAAHLAEITKSAPQFLITFEYDQTQMNGPPFSIDDDEVRRCYQSRYVLSRVVSADVVDRLKDRVSATEHIWLLRSKCDGSGSLA